MGGIEMFIKGKSCIRWTRMRGGNAVHTVGAWWGAGLPLRGGLPTSCCEPMLGEPVRGDLVAYPVPRKVLQLSH